MLWFSLGSSTLKEDYLHCESHCSIFIWSQSWRELRGKSLLDLFILVFTVNHRLSASVKFVEGGVTTRSRWSSPTLDFLFPGGFCYGLYHCGMPAVIMLTVINCNIFRFKLVDAEGEICPRPTATEPGGYPRDGLGSILDEKLWSLICLFLIPV